MAELVTLYDKEGKAHTVVEYEVAGRIQQGWTYSPPGPFDAIVDEIGYDTGGGGGGSVWDWLGDTTKSWIDGVSNLSNWYNVLVPDSPDAFSPVSGQAMYDPTQHINYDMFKGGAAPPTLDMDALEAELAANLQTYNTQQLDRGNAAWQKLSEQQITSLVYGITEDIKKGWLPDSDEELINRMMTDFNISEITAQRLLPGLSGPITDALAQTGMFNDPANRRGGGGSGGRRLPVYVPPDRRTIEEMVRNQQIALLGAVDEASVGRLTDSYMTGHKQAAEGQSIDPNMNVLEGIRGLDSYKRIHALRPDSFNEAQWVSTQRQALTSGGARNQQAADRAIDLAAMGATASRRNAELSEFSEGFMTDGFFSRIRRAAQQVGEQI